MRWSLWKRKQLHYFAREFDAVTIFDEIVIHIKRPYGCESVTLFKATFRGNIYPHPNNLERIVELETMVKKLSETVKQCKSYLEQIIM